MTPRTTDYQERKDRILAMVVDAYIKTVSPVSSQYVIKEYSIDLSSATIRNILSELEEEEYLTHPHTSAGRVPTQRGYRYFVDHLMDEIHLLEEEKKRILAEYQENVLQLESLLEKTSEVISEMTHYTSIISVDGWQNKMFCRGTSFVAGHPEFHDVQKIRDILYLLEEKEKILDLINCSIEERVKIYIGAEMKCNDMEGCSLVVSRYGKKDGPSGRIALLGPTRMDYQRVVSALEYFSDLMNQIL